MAHMGHSTFNSNKIYFEIDCQLPKTLTVTTYNNNGNNFQVN